MKGFLRGIKAWGYGVLIGLDQLGNCLAFGFPDETISSRLGRAVKRKKDAGKVGCEILDTIDTDHCASSIEENPDGSTNAHHLGRVIRELPRDPMPRFTKVPEGEN